jgi:hypothetical protein
MKSILVSVTVFVAVFGGALAGMGLRRVLPRMSLVLMPKRSSDSQLVSW